MTKKRRKFTSEEKVLVSDFCDEYSLHPTQFIVGRRNSLNTERQRLSLKEYYNRRKRYGKVNGHNSWLPSFNLYDDGCRHRSVVAVSPGSVWIEY